MPKTAHASDPRTRRARELRRAMTDAERRLWFHLKRIPVEGSHFRRQAPIGPYFADFACHRMKLIIELDGGQHGLDVNRERDERRSDYLQMSGYRILRFWNHEVFQTIEAVLDTIYAAAYEAQNPIGRVEPLPADPTPNPSPQGGGEH